MMKLKQKTICASLALLAAIAFTPAAHAEGTIAVDKLSVGTDLTYPPYNYFDDSNHPAGFDVELMTALSKAANLEVKFSDTRFESKRKQIHSITHKYSCDISKLAISTYAHRSS